MLAELKKRLRKMGSPERARVSQTFFKTGKGEYGEGDQFLGITVPELRRLAREFSGLSLKDTSRLLHSPIHEERFVALVHLVHLYKKGDAAQREAVYRFYVDHFPRINNWDLVDVSAEHVPGAHLFERSRAPLRKWSRSPLLWERRIAVISTFHFIRRGQFADTLELAERLLKDEHDLMHKAVGWMLREVGKRDRQVLEKFLKAHYASMPRTMLRYAIERLPPTRRQAYLKGRL